MLRSAGDEIEQDEGEIVQPLDEDDAIQSVHERNADAEGVRQQEIDRAVAAEQQLHATAPTNGGITSGSTPSVCTSAAPRNSKRTVR